MIRSRTVLAISVVAVLLTPAILVAHARLTRSLPAANERLDRSPERLSLWFSEKPELRFTSVRLLDSADAPIEIGAAAKIDGDALGIVATLPRSLGPGRYTVAWRTAASDGHPSTGRFSFSVIAAPTDTARTGVRPLPVSADRHDQAKPNEVISAPVGQKPLNTAEHWALLVAVLTVIGAVAFRASVLTRSSWTDSLFADASDRARRLAQGALALALVASLTRLAAEASLMPSGTGGMRSMWEVARDTTWGHGWLVGAGGIVIAAVGFSKLWRANVGWVIAAVGALGLALSQSLTGHAVSGNDGFAIAVTSDVAHLLGAGAWIGGLVSVVLAGLPALGRQREADRPVRGATMVRAYHDVALPSVFVVGISGLVNTWLRVGGISALVGSAYGRVLIVKLVLFVILAGFGYYHWRTVVAPGWSPTSALRFRRTAYMELLVGALVLTATALLVSMATPDALLHAH